MKSQRTRQDQQHQDPRPRLGLWGLGCWARWLRTLRVALYCGRSCPEPKQLSAELHSLELYSW